MEKITTYYATRKNVLVWMAALLCLVSAVARIVFACVGGIDGMNPVVRIILPVAANIWLGIRLLLRGEKQFYVTVIPVILLTWVLCLDGVSATSKPWSFVVIALCIIFALLYFMTFIGKVPSKFFVLVFFVGAVALGGFALGAHQLLTKNLYYEELVPSSYKWLVNSDLALLFAILVMLLGVRKMPPWKEGDPYRLRFGDRLDGRRIHDMPVMTKVTPFFMTNRLGRSNYVRDSVEVSNMERYIIKKRREGLKHFGITHVIVASYVRLVAEMPGLNRFVAGQKIYHRFELSMNMVVKKEMNKDAPDSSIRVRFDPGDTADQVYEKFNEAMENARNEGVANGFDALTHALDYVPSVLLAIFGGLVRLLDYFGLLPNALEQVSPLHGSFYITSMGSLGIPPIYHHLYDIGTVPVFCAFGHKYTKYEPNKNGEIETKKYIDYTVVCDEGICDGFYYAAAMKKLRSYMLHPERLDLPPEEVIEDLY
ncbi:MAG: hypothetical protein J5928_02130 [Firmicutes bacterium]|nr:hypothetical protein [Bacillota bacterium]